MEPLAAMHAQALQQHQVISRSQARAHGLSDSTITDHLRRLGWEPAHRGLWQPAQARADALRDVTAAWLAAGEPALITGATALWSYGVMQTPPARVEMLLPAKRYLRRRPERCLHYTRGFEDLRHRWVSGLPTAPVPRALADHSGHCTANALTFLIADACRLRLCIMEHVTAELDSRARFPGRLALREAVRQLTGELTHSRYERLGRRLLREAGMRFHPTPYLVEDHGRKIAEIDIAQPRLRYGVEVDGPPHLMADVAAKDRARDRSLGLLGWTIDRYLWTDLTDQPERFVHEVRARLDQLEAGGE